VNCRWLGRSVLLLLALVAIGCGQATETDYPAVSGRRGQSASVVARVAVPWRVGAYELVFPTMPGEIDQARRAALLVELNGGPGARVQGAGAPSAASWNGADPTGCP
jgi:hypothetical protein